MPLKYTQSQLSISHLKMIYTIDQCDTVKQAAEALFITQPALSNRIREAERRLNTQLFVRRGRNIAMSHAGLRLLRSAKRILEELAQVEYDISRLSGGVEQVVRVGLPHYASFKWLPSVLDYFDREMPELELEISADSAQRPLQALYNGDIDIALISTSREQLKLDNKSFESTPILQDELLACLSSRHPLAKRAFLQAEDFSRETYITNTTVPEKDREYELFFEPARVLPQRVLQVGFTDAIIELVTVNMGLTILSKWLIQPYLQHKSLRTARLGKNGLNIYWHLVYPKENSTTDIAKVLAKVLREQVTLLEPK